MINVGIVGATGYTGVELLRLLSGHPQVEIKCVTSRGEAGSFVADLFPSLRGVVNLTFTTPDIGLLKECELVFFATPNGIAMHSAAELLEAGCKIIDLSADFRLKDADEWAEWYGETHASPELLEQAIYGLPELNRDKIKAAKLIANPGCYPTAIQLGFLPLLEKNLIVPDSLIADAKSGVSGAGRKEAMSSQFCEASDSFKAYSASGHRHLPEITQSLQGVSEEGLKLVFVPHLTPLIRGIHATLYATLKESSIDLQQLFSDRYREEPFVDVMEAGAHPNTSSVRGSNTCRMSWHRPQSGNTVVVLVVEDNLVKGAAGQAVQNMNLMFGLPETTGLKTPAIFP
ncbi:MAG: N-acetyl-gamma-glutamyl-phosphate reductase [Planctomycetota bacterium]|jgi:N-acetyl-gamma-glutamyl-phosphate reductase